MNELATTTSLLPVRADVTIRTATMADVPFMDQLQKAHSKQLGYFPTRQFEGYVEGGHVLVAWAARPCGTGETPVRLGYVIAKDRYLKRDELGVIYQLCVAPTAQRKLIGASLLKAVFEQSAYGCRLYCCWCAQDIGANHFWESMGFVPLAYRVGSEKRGRVHIFWQRRINADDRATPYWFPAKTDAGALREDRLVLPIPPGTHWSAEMPRIAAGPAPGRALIHQPTDAKARRAKAALAAPAATGPVRHGPRQYGPPGATPQPAPAGPAGTDASVVGKKPTREKPPKPKADPKRIAAARELRDRYLEHVNRVDLRPPPTTGKYDVSRALPPAGTTGAQPPAPLALPHAA